MPETVEHRRSFRFGLRLRFIMIIMITLIAMFSVLAYLLLRNARENLTSDLNRNSVAFAQLAVRPIGDAYEVYQSYGSVRVQQEVKKFTTLDTNVTNVTVVSVEGETVFNLHGTKNPVSLTAASSFDPTYTVGAKGAYTTIVQPYFDTNGQHQFGVSYTISTASLETTIRQQFQTIILLSILGLLLTAGVTYWLINRFFLRSLELVSRASLAISNGEYARQIGSSRNDEIGDLARSVNQMATNLKSDIYKLQEVDKLKNEFIMITSHNLRTPLTIMEGNVELLKSSELPSPIMAMIDAVETGLQRLASFSEDILTIATIENGESKLTTRPVTIESMVHIVHDTYAEVANQRGLHFQWQVEQPDTVVNVSSINIRSVVRNLLDNAMKFTNEGGEVRLTITITGQDMTIQVTDNGIGIAPEEMQHLFTKFHRGTSTLTYDYEGTGIGLYATKLIVQAHGGKVTASSTLGKGSTFTVTLPGVVQSVEQRPKVVET